MNLVLGDWSDDGHGKTEKILVEVNKTVEEIQQGYNVACEVTGYCFHENSPYKQLLTNYEDNEILHTDCDKLLEFGLNVVDHCKETQDGSVIFTSKEFRDLWFHFVNIAIPDIQWVFIDECIPNINGYWGYLNEGFGYGLYS